LAAVAVRSAVSHARVHPQADPQVRLKPYATYYAVVKSAAGGGCRDEERRGERM